MHVRYITTLGLALISAVGLPFAFAEAVSAASPDPFGGWGGVLSSSPLVVGLMYVFRETMTANRARELDQKEREKLAQDHELRLEQLRVEQSKETDAALRELSRAIDHLSTNCARGRNDSAIVRT